MTSDWLGRVILRDLGSLLVQLNGYDDERDIWRPVLGIANTTGTLALHLAGNLEHYIGAELGRSGYVRDRDAEFETRSLPRAELLELVEKSRAAVQAAFQKIGDESLEEEYPLEVGGARLTTGLFLLHLATHLAYHLGQIDYHRRVVTGGESLMGMQSIPALVGTPSDG